MLTVSQPREYTDKNGEVKTQWTRLGVAFKTKDGKGVRVILNALPMPDKNGECTLLVSPQEEKPKSDNDMPSF